MYAYLRCLPVLLALITLTWMGCADGGQPGDQTSSVPGITDSTITIGSWAPLSGPAAAWGAVGQGTDAFFKMINEDGGIHGRKLKLLLRDDQYQPARTVAAVREMIERDNVFAFTVGVGTATGAAAQQLILDHNVPWVGPASGSTTWAYPPKKNVFSVYPLYADEAAMLVDYAIQEMDLKKLGILYLNDEYGKSGLVGTQMKLAQHEMELVEAVSVELTDTDLSSQILKLQEAGAEAVLLWSIPQHAAISQGTAAKLGFSPQWFGSSTLSDARLMHTITKGLWAGTIFASFAELPTSDHPLMARYQAAREKYAPEVLSEVFFLAGFMFAEPLVEALKQAGPDVTRESLVATLDAMDGFQGIGPVISYNPDLRQGNRSSFIAQVGQDGIAVKLTDWKQADLDVNEIIQRLHQ